MAASAEEIRKHVRIYIGVFIALAILTVFTVFASSWHLPIVAAVVVAMAIATVKGSLVAGFFMHLLFDKHKPLIALLILCAFFFAVLMLLPVIINQEAVALHDVP